MYDSRRRDMLYMLFAIQFAVIGSADVFGWGGLLFIIAVVMTVILVLRECARTLGSIVHSQS